MCGWIPGSHRKSPGGQVSVSGHFSSSPRVPDTPSRMLYCPDTIPWTTTCQVTSPPTSSSTPTSHSLSGSPSHRPLSFSCFGSAGGVRNPSGLPLWCPGTLGHSIGAICEVAPKWGPLGRSSALSLSDLCRRRDERAPCLRKVLWREQKLLFMVALQRFLSFWWVDTEKPFQKWRPNANSPPPRTFSVMFCLLVGQR